MSIHHVHLVRTVCVQVFIPINHFMSFQSKSSLHFFFLRLICFFTVSHDFLDCLMSLVHVLLRLCMLLMTWLLGEKGNLIRIKTCFIISIQKSETFIHKIKNNLWQHLEKYHVYYIDHKATGIRMMMNTQRRRSWLIKKNQSKPSFTLYIRS